MNMKNVYYPLAGMNYVIDDLAQILENKMDGKKKLFFGYLLRLIVIRILEH